MMQSERLNNATRSLLGKIEATNTATLKVQRTNVSTNVRFLILDPAPPRGTPTGAARGRRKAADPDLRRAAAVTRGDGPDLAADAARGRGSLDVARAPGSSVSGLSGNG